MTKKWYASKTFWFNVLALVVAVAGQYGYTGALPAEWEVFAPVLVILVNLVLRLFVTKEPVERTLI
jgi:hypothetical protein